MRVLRSADAEGVALPSGERVEGDWVVRLLPGTGSTKDYRCPGCDHEVAAGTAHTVAWPQGQTDLRRHWHTPCWAARDRRHRR